MSTQEPTQQVVIACDLTALNAEQREQHITNSIALFASAQEARDLPNGYALRLPAESSTLLKLADFISYDRLCCPFMHYGVEVQPHGKAIWLQLTGVDGVKQLLSADIARLLKPGVALAAGLKQAA